MGTRVWRHIVLLAAAGGIAACALVIGIEDRPLREVSVTDGGGEATTPPDPCLHATTPLPPEKDDDDERRDYSSALRLVRYEADKNLGLDIDGVCTCHPGPNTAFDGAASCGSPTPDAARCDGDGGVDNALASLPFLNLAGLNENSLAKQLECGRGGLLFLLFGYNGRANDRTITLGFVPTGGIRTPHEPTEDAACDGGGYAPRWKGDDTFAPNEAFLQAPNVPRYLLEGHVRDWTLVASTKSAVPVPLAGLEIETQHAFLVAKIVPLDADHQPIEPTSEARASRIRLEGLMTGRASTDGLLKAMQGIKIGGATLCPGDQLHDQIRTQICSAADIRFDPSADFANEPCDGISMGLRFIAEPALSGPSVTLPASGRRCSTDPTPCRP